MVVEFEDGDSIVPNDSYRCRRFTLPLVFFVMQAFAITTWAARLAIDPRLLDNFSVLILLPASVWAIEVVALLVLTKNGPLSGSIGLLIGAWFVVADSDWGSAPTYWFVWEGYSTAPELNAALEDFGLFVVATGLFVWPAFVERTDTRILLRLLGLGAIFLWWLQIPGAMFPEGWKFLSSLPLMLFACLLFTPLAKKTPLNLKAE